jgi:hypothetical protein
MAGDRPLAVLVTRREHFTRLERVQTLDRSGPLVEVPDYEDRVSHEELPPGSTMKDAIAAYSRDPSVVEVREDRD